MNTKKTGWTILLTVLLGLLVNAVIASNDQWRMAAFILLGLAVGAIFFLGIYFVLE